MRTRMRALLVSGSLACIMSGSALGQTELRGTVLERDAKATHTPVVGANVYWLGTGTGVTTSPEGTFALPLRPPGSRLVVSAVGYLADTLVVTGSDELRVQLRPEARQVADVEVIGERSPTLLEYMTPSAVQVMTEKELFKAACCNLSESFETNPSIDVAFTDAVTGTRQIEMLGLAGIYSQITVENLPAIRGLTSNVGLTYIPGTWIENIQVSKGVGSVANGYESITGQINVELRRPKNDLEPRLFVNMYGSDDIRLETNLRYRERLSEDWTSITLLHLGSQQRAMDRNGDRFLDLPLSTSINALQRFGLSAFERLEGQVSLQYVEDEKKGGTLRGVGLNPQGLVADPAEYGFRSKSRQWRLAGKTGYLLAEGERHSIGLQYSYADYQLDAFFGVREYSGRERTGYLNLLFEQELGSGEHLLRAGLSFLYDDYDETFSSAAYRRTERVPGAFAEYTLTPDERFSMVAGLRVDRHNLFAAFVTPRLHVRYAPSQDWVVRAVAGRGQRTASVFAENFGYLASARTFDLPPAPSGYPFGPEVAWNIGFNVTRYFTWGGREGTLVADLYRTVFERQVVVDLDRSPRSVRFSDLDGESFSNSIQLELNLRPLEKLDTRLAYRYLDVRQTTAAVLQQRPFVARHRAFVNLGYSTEREAPDDARMLYDLTLQWFGRKRLPDTRSNPSGLQTRESSPDFAVVNALVTRSFSVGFDLYVGVENLLDFRQTDPILDPGNPGGPYFDGSSIWGPVVGRMTYIGVRLTM